jgi:hypothetical protein
MRPRKEWTVLVGQQPRGQIVARELRRVSSSMGPKGTLALSRRRLSPCSPTKRGAAGVSGPAIRRRSPGRWTATGCDGRARTKFLDDTAEEISSGSERDQFSGGHVRNFLDCIKSYAIHPISVSKAPSRVSSMCHLANLRFACRGFDGTAGIQRKYSGVREAVGDGFITAISRAMGCGTTCATALDDSGLTRDRARHIVFAPTMWTAGTSGPR